MPAPRFSPGAPIARSAKPSPLKLPTASDRPKSSPASASSAIPAESCDQNCEPVVSSPVALPVEDVDGAGADVLARRADREVAEAVAVEVALGGGGSRPAGAPDGRRRGRAGDGAGSQRMAGGVAVVGPVDRLAAADALAVRRDREALVVEVGHAGGAGVFGHDGEDCRCELTSNTRLRPSQLLSQTTHSWFLSASQCSAAKVGKPLANVATRVKLLEVWSRA